MAEQRTRRPHGPMGGPGRGMMPGEKPKDFKNSIEKLVRYLGRYWYAIVAVMIFAAVSTVFSVAGPKVMARATNALVEGLGKKIAGTGSIDFTYIAKVLLFTLGLYICSAVFSFIQGMIMTGITQKTCYRMRKEISEKINRMPMKYFESRTYGEVLSRITNDVDTLGQSLNHYECGNTGRNTCDDDFNFRNYDIDFTCDSSGICHPDFVYYQTFAEIFPPAAGISGTYQRTGGRGLWRTSGGAGI